MGRQGKLRTFLPARRHHVSFRFIFALLAAALMMPPAIATAADPTRVPRLLSEGTPGTAASDVGAASVVPPGFTDTSIFSGLAAPIALRFSPDGRVFVAEKSGLIKVFANLSATTPTVFADLRTRVNNFWDRGLLGFTLDPSFPTVPYAYVMYAYDALIGGTAPVWNDACPSPPGPTTDGCTISGRMSRLTVSGDVVTGAEQVLVNDWCQQYPSHSVGDLRFGPDGMLYATAGDGGSFTFVDWGQGGGSAGSPTPKNPCGDPPGGVGGAMTAPTALGGALRSQSIRRPAGQPIVLNGSLLRVNPATGAGLPDSPMGGSSSANARRIVGFGFRNPFRFTFRPGTSEVWIGDVGDGTYEEINRIVNPLASAVANAGWPCYEGPNKHSGYQAANLDLCASLYLTPTNLLAPYYAYRHDSKVVTGETCTTGSSAISGLAFYESGTYPSSFNGALFFADHSRNCIWAILAGTNGLPDKSQIQNFVRSAANPVGVEIGPGGDVYYVDHEGGAIHRVSYSATNHPPIAAIDATPTSGPTPLTVAFDGSGSTDPDPGDTLTFSWDLDGNGAFGDAVLATASQTYTVNALYTVALRVTDSHGLSATTTTTINAGSGLPQPVIDTPAASLIWSVGDEITFSGQATDAQGAAIPESGLTWTEILHHCPSDCHTHTVQTFDGVDSDHLFAPDHDYPSFLELRLTATDGAGNSASTSVSLDPRTAGLSIASSPAGIAVGVGTTTPVAAPFSRTVIAKSLQSVSAPPSQTIGGTIWTFASWSDGGALAHTVTVPAGGLSLTATYTSAQTTAYLSDLAYSVVANGWGPPEKDRSNGENGPADGLPLTLNGVVYAKGIGAHAASDIRYALNGACSTFSAKVGIDDEMGANGSVVLQVWADGVKLADSGLMTATTATKTLTADVTGRTTLQLVVTNGGDNINSDHGDWADAQLTCGGGGPPPDTTPPTVIGQAPAGGATDVATGVRPTVTFSEAINPATITTATVSLTPQGGSSVGASVAYDGPTRTATLTPTAALAAGTTYTVRVKGGSTGVADLAGIRLVADVTWTFATASSAQTTAYLSDLAYSVVANGWGPPEKDRSNGENGPADGLPLTLNGVVYAKGIGAHAASDIRYALNGACSTFSAKVGIDDEMGANGSVVLQVWADGVKLADSGLMTATTATKTLTADVTGRTTLQLVVTNGGDNINSDHGDWADAQLTCGGGGPPPDTTPPTVIGQAPAGGATDVATGVRPTVTFSEAINPATITTATVSLTPQGGSSVGASVAYDGPTRTATLTPTAALAAGTTYTVRVKGGSTGVADLAGIRLVADVTWTFATASSAQTTAYLSDLAYSVVANGWGPPEKDRSNGENGPADGLPLTLNGVVYAKGIGAHAASDIRYALNGACSTFSAKVGIDDEMGANGSVVLQVWADGVKLADSGLMTATTATKTLTADVTGRTTLQLVVTNGGDNINSDHGDWADAQLTCGG